MNRVTVLASDSDQVSVLRDVGAPGWVVLAVVLIGASAYAIKQLQDISSTVNAVRHAIAIKGRAERRRQHRLRRRFAEHLEGQFRFMNSQEEWSDTRFAELEAEVEFELRQGTTLLGPLWRRSSTRRAASLSRALQKSPERLIVLQGEPGSGKSVALRHLGEIFTRRARSSNNPKSILPVYVNLKELRVPADLVSAADIESLVRESLTRVDLGDVSRFVAENFDKGLEEGLWLFLFDSFDEIPYILSATEEDVPIRRYRQAIFGFLNGLNTCRGIVASREFRGPGTYGVTTFRILPLSASRRSELIRRAELPPSSRKLLSQGLPGSEDAVRELADNPLFLSLLCEHVRDSNQFPESSHAVFEGYVEKRLRRDTEAVKRRFGVDPVEVRGIAESIAFAMTSQSSLGLSPRLSALEAALPQDDETTSKPRFRPSIEALRYIKLLRIEILEQDAKISFSHRRFQEYFATCLLLRDDRRVSVRPRTLLQSGQWREAAVTMLQTQNLDRVKTLTTAATRLLTTFTNQLKTDRATVNSARAPILWPRELFHLLSILDAGLASRKSDRPAELIAKVDEVLRLIDEFGLLVDRKWVVDVVGSSSTATGTSLLRHGLEGDSSWVRAVAYRQAGRLKTVPKEIEPAIRRTLLTTTQQGELRRDRRSTAAQLRNLESPTALLRALRLALSIPAVDFALSIAVVAFCLGTWQPSSFAWISSVAIMGFLLHSSLYFLRAGAFFSWPGESHKRLRRQLQSFFLGPPDAFGTNMLFFSFRVFFVVGLSVDETRSTNHNWLVALLIAYPMLWSAGALLAVRDGKLVAWWWWGLHPLLAIFHPLRVAIRTFLKTWRRIIGFFLFGAAMLALITALSSVLDGVGSDRVFGAVLLSAGALFVLAIAISITRGVLARIGDARRLKEWDSNNKIPSNGDDVEQMLRELRLMTARSRLLRLWRVKYDLPPKTDILSRLASLLVEEGRSPVLSLTDLARELRLLVKDRAPKRRVVRPVLLDPAGRDEAGRLIEVLARAPSDARPL